MAKKSATTASKTTPQAPAVPEPTVQASTAPEAATQAAQDVTAAVIDQQMKEINDDIAQLGDDVIELTHLVIRSVRARFRRAGRTFTRDAQVVAKADLSDADLEALKAEPNLVVTEISEPLPADEVDADKSQQVDA